MRPLRERAGMEKPPGCFNSKAASSGRPPGASLPLALFSKRNPATSNGRGVKDHA